MSWPIVALGELMANRTPSLNPAKHPDETFELWSIPAFDAGAPEHTLGSQIGSAKKIVEPDDVLLSRIVPHIRRAWVVTPALNRERQIASGEWIIFRSEKIHPPYLRHVLLGDTFHAAFMSTVAGVGGSLLRARPEAVKRIEIALPPLPEQRRIAAILDQADALRCLRRQSLSRLSELGQAIFFEMFGDLANDSYGWQRVSFSSIAERITVGVVVKPASYYVEQGVPAIRGTNIKAGGIDLSDVVYFSEETNERVLAKTRVWTDDLVIVRSGRPGLAALVPPNLSGCNTIDVLIMTPDKRRVRPRFLQDLVNSSAGKRMVLSESRGQIQQHFNVKSLSSATTPLPPLEIQDEYVRRMDALDKAADTTDAYRTASEHLFGSLQHRAFCGEL